MFNLQSSISLALLAAGMMAGTAWGAEYFVATNGLDTNSRSQPLLDVAQTFRKGRIVDLQQLHGLEAVVNQL